MSSLTPSPSSRPNNEPRQADLGIGGVPQADQLIGGQPNSSAPFAGAVVPKASAVEIDPVQQIFDMAMERMYPGPLYSAFKERLEELKRPVDPDLESKAAAAVAIFEKLEFVDKVKTLNSMLSEKLLTKRASWPIPGAPRFKVPPPESRANAEEKMREVAQELLLKGTLPAEHVQHVANSVIEKFPPSAEINERLGMLGGAAALSTALFIAAPLWVAAPIAVGACVFALAQFRRPTLYSEYVRGFLTESLDSTGQVYLGGAVPLGVTLKVHFEGVMDGQERVSAFQKDGFLLSRALRVLGRPAEEIVSSFQCPYPVTSSHNALVPALEKALEEHGIELKMPLALVAQNMKDKENQELFRFLDLMTVSHFLWAARDREKLRGEMADIVLASQARAQAQAV